MKKSHIHAEKMAQYAQDAAETDRPWERWELRFTRDGVMSPWRPLQRNPDWVPSVEYQRKPRTININGREVPEPLREAPADGQWVWIASPGHLDNVHQYQVSRFMGFDTADRWAACGLMHATREAAEIHAKALLSFTNGEGRS